MPEKENTKNFESLLSYGIKEKFSIKKSIVNEILIILFSLLPIIFSEENIVFLILSILTIIFYPILIFMVKNRQTMEDILYIFQSGVFSLCISFLAALLSIEILLIFIDEKEKILAVCLTCASYIFIFLSNVYMSWKSIERKDCITLGIISGLRVETPSGIEAEDSNNKKIARRPIIFALCGMACVGILRILQSGIGLRKMLGIVSIFCVIIAIGLIPRGVLNICRFLYFAKHKELANK